MADFPALPVFTDAYLADTRHLSTEEHGAYLLLLMEAWRRPECNLPDDDKLLSRLCGLPLSRWQEIKGTILAFWVRDGRRKTWTQKRLLKERSYVAQKSALRRDSAAKRWNKTKNDDANAMQSECKTDAPTPTPTPTYSVDKSTGADAPVDPVKVMFDSGRALLAEAGKSKDAAGKLLGKWRSDYGEEAVISALGKAKREGAIDPVAFIEGCLRQSSRKAVDQAAYPRHGEERQFPDGTTRIFDQFMGWKIVH